MMPANTPIAGIFSLEFITSLHVVLGMIVYCLVTLAFMFFTVGIYMSDGGMLPAGGGGAYVTPGTTIPMRPPMSRLGRRRSTTNDEFSVFPDPGQVEPVVSGTNPELFSRTLSESWWSQPTENMHRQVRVGTANTYYIMYPQSHNFLTLFPSWTLVSMRCCLAVRQRPSISRDV